MTPLTQLILKGQHSAWTDRCKQSLVELEKRSIRALVLVIVDTNKPFEVYCDVSHQGLGGLLMQGKKVAAYASRQLKIHKNYSTHDIALAGRMFTLKIWRHY